MSTQLKATFFSVSSPEGRRLKDAFMEMSGEYNLSAEVVERGTQADLKRCAPIARKARPFRTLRMTSSLR
jgi:hypothetical protein